MPNSWLPLTPSVLVAATAPAARLVSLCAAPGALALPPGAINASWFGVAVRCTGPIVPLVRLLARFVVLASRAVSAPATVVWPVVVPIVPSGLMLVIDWLKPATLPVAGS